MAHLPQLNRNFTSTCLLVWTALSYSFAFVGKIMLCYFDDKITPSLLSNEKEKYPVNS